MSGKFDHTKLQPGDPVAYVQAHGTWYGSTIYWSTVDRLTPTQIVLANASRFRREDGRIIGGGGYRGKLVDPNGREATSARINAIHNRAASSLYELQRAKESTTTDGLSAWLDKVSAVVEESRARLREIAGGVS